MKKINTEFIFASNFAQNITQLVLVFLKEAILFLIYLLADKANCVLIYRIYTFLLRILILFAVSFDENFQN